MQEMSRKNKLFTDSVIRRMTRISIDCGTFSVCTAIKWLRTPTLTA